MLRISLLLLILLSVTRSGMVAHALDASWAVFFLMGLFQVRLFVLALAFLWVAGVDQWVVWNLGIGASCLTPAYFALIPAYASLFIGGYLLRKWMPSTATKRWIALFLAVLLSSLICEFISSGSFYLMSGYFEAPSWQGYLQRLVQFYPHYWLSMSAYVMVFWLLSPFFSLKLYRQSWR